ncbi:MAG: DUF2334 domain-containing protein [Ignavibacteriaceae bacterium]|nr:DUF2334 domain-containing protein [Ignavibacteriaceae bacterium]
MKILIYITLFLSNFLYSQDSLIFVIRVDDIYSRSAVYIPQTIIPFQNAVESRGGKVTWGVMPHRLIENMNNQGNLSAELKATIQAGHEISQHGYIHICSKCNSSNHEMYCTATQFAFSYQVQMNLIKQGLKILRDSVGVKPVSFIPPGHAADSVTYSVLLDSSFTFISTTGPRKEYLFRNLYNLPAHSEFTWQLIQSQYNSKLTTALQQIRTNGLSDGYYCILFHDPFIRPSYENGIVINWISDLLDSLNNEYAGRIKYLTLSEAATYFSSPATGLDEIFADVPTEFEVMQNYPNPFNPSTQISFILPAEKFVSVKVYDIFGSEIIQLLEENLSGGKHTVTWNGKSTAGNSVSSGVYFYKIVAGEFTKTMKMVLSK